LKSYSHTVRLTHRGPLINYIVTPIGTFDMTQESLSLAWTGYNDDYESLIAIYLNLEATSLEEVKQFLMYGTSYTPSFSMLAATADNHIFYRQAGVNPIKKNYESGNFIKDGTTSTHDWLGFMKPEDRLMLIDPVRGYIVASNNKAAPDVSHGGYFRNAIYTARADRIEELIKEEIASGRKISSAFAKKILHDTVDVYCRQILPEIIAVISHGKSLL
jgi:penicillin G amidase